MQKKSVDILLKLLKKDDNATVTKKLDIKLKRDGDQWEVENEEALTDAVLGGLISAAENMESSFGQ